MATRDTKPCYYCGLPATSEDHTVPRTMLDRLEVAPVAWRGPWVVAACHECNIALGPKWFPNMTERRQAAHAWIRKRYRRLLETPLWNDEQIAELGPCLQSYVRRRQKLRRLIEERLRWPYE